MNRPCNHPDEELPAPGGRYFAHQCHVCWLWVNNPDYRAKIEGQAAQPQPIEPIYKRRATTKPRPTGGCGCGR